MFSTVLRTAGSTARAAARQSTPRLAALPARTVFASPRRFLTSTPAALEPESQEPAHAAVREDIVIPYALLLLVDVARTKLISPLVPPLQLP